MGVRHAIAFSSKAQCVASDIIEGEPSKSSSALHSDDDQTRNVLILDDSFYSLYKAAREKKAREGRLTHTKNSDTQNGAKGHRHNSVCSRAQQRVPKLALPENGTFEKKTLRVLYHNSSKCLSFCSIHL